MSIAPFLAGATKGFATTVIGGLATKLFGGGENIARSLSAQVGCTIRQADADAARSFIAKGINPCTMQPMSPASDVLAPSVPQPTAPIKPVITVPPGGAPPVSMQLGVGGIAAGAGQLIRRGVGAITGPGILRTTTGRISSIVLPTGQRFTRKRAAEFIRRFGPEVAAAALGITIVEAAEILLTQAKTRRRRGITAAQVRNARRTACMVSRLARDLGVKPAPVRRRSTCR